ncbi:MAG: hypothetical protein ACHQIM_15075 [Sphingobacteriales bacterium]
MAVKKEYKRPWKTYPGLIRINIDGNSGFRIADANGLSLLINAHS